MSAKKPEGSDASKVERCAAWLKTFLQDYAYPSAEILEAAKGHKFTFDNVKEAKLVLKGEGLRNSNSEPVPGQWWSGFGLPCEWITRPDPRLPSSPPTPTTPQTPHTRSGETGERREREAKERVVAKRNNEEDVQSARERYLARKKRKLEEEQAAQEQQQPDGGQ